MIITQGLIDVKVRSVTFIIWSVIEEVGFVYTYCHSDVQYYSRNCLKSSGLSFYE